jgi:O-antigen/teichoic acid export membrane protein
MTLAKRSITSVTWNVLANVIQMLVQFVRSVLLARMLPIDVFGVYALAGSIVAMTVIVANFGMGGAFLHRAPETRDEEQAAAAHFTLKLIFVSIWATLMAVGATVFTTGQLRTALLLLAVTTGLSGLGQTPRLILTRRVVHRRLALLQLLTAIATTLVALVMAWQGATLWALLSTDIIELLLTFVFLYVWRPVWKPRLSWSLPTIRYFLGFGSRNFLGVVLLRALDRVDDLWTGVYLGDVAMGFYSKAYRFATYPRAILAAPINTVAGGTYAELKENRKRLSQAFFRTNALLIRSSFFLAGLLALIAPEFIRLLLTAKWLPMLDAFRLMLVFTLLDPIKVTVGDLFIAMGRPEQVVQARLVQLAVLMVGLLALGPLWGIAGVALAVDLMLVVGMLLLFWKAREHVDFSVRTMFGVPTLALVVGMIAARASILIPGVLGSDWRTGGVKILAFGTIYAAMVVLLERDQIPMLLDAFRQLRPTESANA